MEPAGCSVDSSIETTALSMTADWMSGSTNYIKFVPTKGETTAFATLEITGCALATTFTPKGSVFVEATRRQESRRSPRKCTAPERSTPRPVAA